MMEFTISAPTNWNLIRREESGVHFLTPFGLSVIVSVCRENDGKNWLHLSCAYNDRLPSWRDLVYVKESIIGLEKEAIQVIPAKSKHVNIHPNCLHLFHCLDGNPLPDFRKNGLL
jgi:hypothetical protein